MAPVSLVFFLFLIAPVVMGLGFWLFALFECVIREPASEPTRLKWILIVFFGNVLGAAAYLVMRRPLRIDLYGR